MGLLSKGDARTTLETTREPTECGKNGVGESSVFRRVNWETLGGKHEFLYGYIWKKGWRGENKKINETDDGKGVTSRL